MQTEYCKGGILNTWGTAMVEKSKGVCVCVCVWGGGRQKDGVL